MFSESKQLKKYLSEFEIMIEFIVNLFHEKHMKYIMKNTNRVIKYWDKN